MKIAEMNATKEGREKMMTQISGAWDSLCTPGNNKLGWDGLKKM